MFKLGELIEATGGRLIRGRPEARVKGISLDSRALRRGEAFIAIKGENFDGHCFVNEALNRGAGCVVVNKGSRYRNGELGISKRQKRNAIAVIEVGDTIKALGDIAAFHRNRFSLPVIAVTGSNGKTTTKEMIAAVLSRRYKVLKNPGTKNNHIGLPQALLQMDASCGCAVVELGTNHFGEIDYLARICRPNIAVITNIGPSHLEHFKDLPGVLREKASLLEYLSAPSAAVLNADDPLLKGLVYKNSSRHFILGYGIKEKSDFFAWGIKACGCKMEFRLWEYKYSLNALGYYNIYNALAAAAVGRIFGLGHCGISRALAGFRPPQGRLEFTEFQEISFINDTYNSNPLSLAQALQALKDFPGQGRKIFVMGDMLELGDRSEALHRRAAQEIAGACDIFIAAGRLSRFTAEELRRLGMAEDRVFCCADSRQAREFLWRKAAARPRDIVLVKGSRAMRMEEVLEG